MEYIRNTTDIQITVPTVVSLGKFDGLHTGHKLLVEHMLQKKQDGLATVMFTFDISPKSFINQEVVQVLTTETEKKMLLEQAGVDYFVEYPFTQEVRCMEPEAFIRMLVEKLQVKCIVAGMDFRFGYNRSGDYKTLQQFGSVYGYETIILDKKEYEHREISSTFIREEIQKGDMEKANLLLGYEYFVRGTVVHGRKLGRKLGIPTVNLLPTPEKLLPPFGVYISKVVVDGVTYGGITNVGRKPTIDGEHPVGVETNIFEFHGDVYGKEIEVHFLKFLRNEKKFHSVEELKTQMRKDINCGKEYIKNRKEYL